MTDALTLCKSKLAELNKLRPLNKEQEDRLLQKLRLEWDFHSNHLEGNSLTYGETRALILYGLTAQGKPIKDHIEISGHHEAILLIEDLVRRKEPMTEALIRQLHVLVLKEDHEISAITETGEPTTIRVEVGRYKTSPNHVKTVTGETLFFSSPADTPIHIHELLKWYRVNKNLDPVEISSVFHHRFTRIHPFTDGNGRVARLLGNFILMMGGYPPVIIKTQEKDAYYAALRLGDAGNPTAFAEYVATCLAASLDLCLRAAQGEPVDEPDDVYKELALLRKKFEASEDRVEVLRSNDLAQAAWANWMEPLFVAFEASSRRFDDFYIEKTVNAYVQGNGAGNTWEEQMARLRSKVGGARDVSVQIVFSKIKSREHVRAGFSQALRLVMLETHVEIHGEHQKLGEVEWDECPPEIDRKEWIGAEERRHVEFLKQLVGK